MTPKLWGRVRKGNLPGKGAFGYACLVMDGGGNDRSFVGGLLVCLTRRHWNLMSLLAGLFHMVFAATVSFAPFRSWLDPNYLGLSLGFLRFEGRGATLPCALILAWAVASALVAVIKGRGWWITLVLAGDVFLVLNFGGSLLRGNAMESKIQLGETATFSGAWALLILLSVFVVPFVLSAIWCARHLRDSGSKASAHKVAGIS